MYSLSCRENAPTSSIEEGDEYRADILWYSLFSGLFLKSKVQLKETDENFPVLSDEWVIFMRTIDLIQLLSINLNILFIGCLIHITIHFVLSFLSGLNFYSYFLFLFSLY